MECPKKLGEKRDPKELKHLCNISRCFEQQEHLIKQVYHDSGMSEGIGREGVALGNEDTLVFRSRFRVDPQRRKETSSYLFRSPL
ncbi:hypothetical protein CDAR_234271 [Caerostris darwini]|uniref:Uncharacterized protein n=1 Tax=Caerostris darwini TaxID=1538125 RepID=A0AAV4QI26_9ARAC|nr:hypothetical protein CDAR_234271 [Caerostris darwini]